MSTDTELSLLESMVNVTARDMSFIAKIPRVRVDSTSKYASTACNVIYKDGSSEIVIGTNLLKSISDLTTKFTSARTSRFIRFVLKHEWAHCLSPNYNEVRKYIISTGDTWNQYVFNLADDIYIEEIIRRFYIGFEFEVEEFFSENEKFFGFGKDKDQYHLRIHQFDKIQNYRLLRAANTLRSSRFRVSDLIVFYKELLNYITRNQSKPPLTLEKAMNVKHKVENEGEDEPNNDSEDSAESDSSESEQSSDLEQEEQDNNSYEDTNSDEIDDNEESNESTDDTEENDELEDSEHNENDDSTETEEESESISESKDNLEESEENSEETNESDEDTETNEFDETEELENCEGSNSLDESNDDSEEQDSSQQSSTITQEESEEETEESEVEKTEEEKEQELIESKIEEVLEEDNIEGKQEDTDESTDFNKDIYNRLGYNDNNPVVELSIDLLDTFDGNTIKDFDWTDLNFSPLERLRAQKRIKPSVHGARYRPFPRTVRRRMDKPRLSRKLTSGGFSVSILIDLSGSTGFLDISGELGDMAIHRFEAILAENIRRIFERIFNAETRITLFQNMFTKWTSAEAEILVVKNWNDKNSKYAIIKPTHGSGTPIVESMRYEIEQLSKRNNKEKILIVITDGDISESESEEIKTMIRDMRKKKMRCGTIVINESSSADKWDSNYFSNILSLDRKDIIDALNKSIKTFEFI